MKDRKKNEHKGEKNILRDRKKHGEKEACK
jgi:hypothetical protein